MPASTASGPSNKGRSPTQRDLLVAEHAGDADHAAVENGEGEERAGGSAFVGNYGGRGGKFGSHGGEG